MGEITFEAPYLLLVARYERVREVGQVVDCAILNAVGVTASGHRQVLGVSVALSEAEWAWLLRAGAVRNPNWRPGPR